MNLTAALHHLYAYAGGLILLHPFRAKVTLAFAIDIAAAALLYALIAAVGGRRERR